MVGKEHRITALDIAQIGIMVAVIEAWKRAENQRTLYMLTIKRKLIRKKEIILSQNLF